METFTNDIGQVLADTARGVSHIILVPDNKLILALRTLASYGLRLDQDVWVDSSGRKIRAMAYSDTPDSGTFTICNGGEASTSDDHKALDRWLSPKK